jgi:hypothetical protein
MQLLATSKKNLHLANLRSIPCELMVNATAHKSRTDLCRRDLQLSVRAEIVASHWKVDNIFR